MSKLGGLKLKKLSAVLIALIIIVFPYNSILAKVKTSDHVLREMNIKAYESVLKISRFKKESDLEFTYPDAVRGIYVTGPSVGDDRFTNLLELVESTALNAMVIDVKEDYGKLTFKPTDEESKFKDAADNHIKDPKALLKDLSDREIY